MGGEADHVVRVARAQVVDLVELEFVILGWIERDAVVDSQGDVALGEEADDVVEAFLGGSASRASNQNLIGTREWSIGGNSSFSTGSASGSIGSTTKLQAAIPGIQSETSSRESIPVPEPSAAAILTIVALGIAAVIYRARSRTKFLGGGIKPG